MAGIIGLFWTAGFLQAMTGAFHRKAMAIADLRERLAFINRGQGCVVRRLREILARVGDGDLYANLSQMRQSHEANIDLVNSLQ